MAYEAIVIGVSAGGINTLSSLFSLLGKDLPIPIIIVQHISPHSDNKWIELLGNKTKLHIKEAEEKENILPGTIYIAPPNYHLVVERTKTFSLTIDERVNFSRPSIDVLFESAANIYTNKLIGIVLTGSNTDGTEGIKKIQESGGLTVIQDPATAEVAVMPASAMASISADHVLALKDIADLLTKLSNSNQTKDQHLTRDT